nr:MAG TPA: hypothetical protein [Caudoviricetes sp.]
MAVRRKPPAPLGLQNGNVPNLVHKTFRRTLCSI